MPKLPRHLQFERSKELEDIRLEKERAEKKKEKRIHPPADHPWRYKQIMGSMYAKGTL